MTASESVACRSPRPDRTTAAEVMVRRPVILPRTTTLTAVRALLADDHVHMVLLTDGPVLVGTLVRDDLVAAPRRGDAVGWSSLAGRTVDQHEPAEVLRHRMRRHGVRRLAVVDDVGNLLGLLCLQRSGAGFCSDDDVAERAAERARG